MLTEIKTSADMALLPSGLKHALSNPYKNTAGARWAANRASATNKQVLQAAVVSAVKDGSISYDLGVEILVARHAYGKQGKDAMKVVNPRY